MPFPQHPWVPRLLGCLTTSNQGAPGRVNKNPKVFPHFFAGFSQSQEDTLAPFSCPIPWALGQKFSLWRQRQCGGAPSSGLILPGGGAAELGEFRLLPLLPELLLPATLVLFFLQPTPGLHGAPSRPLPHRQASPLCRHLL